MSVYIAVVIGVIALLSVLLTIVLHKNMSNMITIIAIALVSGMLSLAFPFILMALMKIFHNLGFKAESLQVLLIVLVVYMSLIYMFTGFILLFVPDNKIGNFLNRIILNRIKNVIFNLIGKLSIVVETVKNRLKSCIHHIHSGKAAKTDVDANKNDVNSYSINNYIEEAFRLKGNGDLEGAVSCYMHVLDMNPKDELVFWIVLDICTIYKELGQVELAQGILESYVADYGGKMDEAVRIEIEKNLLK